ncbi:hypothetical protein F2P81_001043 [Scophthalmus maximus]|uniref:Uncharacterized protein n=1 Tax=Scophthalmus maximus TaxID=52904 RepID=A0A6A4TUT4_SCOMX|nr:hypothetical protein F2P81_001043 [Scophthalmus maximus]
MFRSSVTSTHQNNLTLLSWECELPDKLDYNEVIVISNSKAALDERYVLEFGESLLRVWSVSSDIKATSMDLTMLTRAHGIKVSPGFPCSVDGCCQAVGDVVGDSSVKSAYRINGGVVMFVETVEKANTVVESGIVINGAFVFVTSLVTPATRVTVSNIPPFIGDDYLRRELGKYGMVMSPLRKLSGSKSARSRI